MAKQPSPGRGSSVLRAAAYIRLSIMTEETNSPDTQFSDIKRRIDAQEWHFNKAEAIVDQATGTKISGGDLFVDLGISGSKGKFRPGYEALMKELENYDRVVVWKIDRLTRRLSELGTVLDLFGKNKVVLVGVSDGVDTGTAAGRTTAELLGTIAGAEARNTSDRVSAAQQTMLRNGKWRGGPAPYGDIASNNLGKERVRHLNWTPRKPST
jgi:site-specific DNA recombinase